MGKNKANIVKLNKNRISGITIRIIGLVLNFLIVFYIGQNYTAEISAQYFKDYSLLMFVSVIGRFGLEELIVKYSSNDSSNESSEFFSFLVNNIPACLVATFVLAILIQMGSFVSVSFFVILVFIAGYNISSFAFSYLNGRNSLLQASIPLFFISPVSFILMLVFSKVLSSADILKFHAISHFIAVVIYFLLLKGLYIGRVNYKVNLKTDLLPLSLSSISAGIASYLSLYLLGNILNSSEFIIWNYVTKILQVLTVAVMLSNIYFAPLYRRLYLSKELNRLSMLFKRQVFLSFLVLMVYILLSPALIFYLIELDESERELFTFLFKILVYGYGISFLLSSIGSLYIMIDKQKVNAIIGVSFSLILTFTLLVFRQENIAFYAVLFSVVMGLPKLLMLVKLYKYVRS